MFSFLNTIFDDYREGAIYDPGTIEDAQIMADLLQLEEKDQAIDLGSGDGRVVIEMAKRGAAAYGIEKNLELVEESRDNIYDFGLQNKAFIIHGNFWHVNLQQFNKIAVYQYRTIMERLEQKLSLELKSESLVVSHLWKFPHWKFIKKTEDMYLYKI